MADQLISTAMHDRLPESYVRPDTQRPRLDEAVPDVNIPVVDLANPNRATVVSQIGAACRSHGFFQVLNHGIPVEFMLPMMTVAQEFFPLPPEEKAKLYSDEPAKEMRLSTSFNVRMETVHNWRDHLRLHHHPLEQFVPDRPANPPPFRLSEGTPLKSSGYGENRRHESKMFALVAPQSLPPGDGSSSSTGAPVPLLWLDSGAAIHVVGDAEILTNLRDPPTKMVVTVADGSQLPITKVGVIQAPNINISDVYLAPGLEMNLVSVRQLAKSEIVTTFYKNCAELWLEGERIGGAIVDNDVSLYRLCFSGRISLFIVAGWWPCVGVFMSTPRSAMLAWGWNSRKWSNHSLRWWCQVESTNTLATPTQ